MLVFGTCLLEGALQGRVDIADPHTTGRSSSGEAGAKRSDEGVLMLGYESFNGEPSMSAMAASTSSLATGSLRASPP
jgi:hypothetical protein